MNESACSYYQDLLCLRPVDPTDPKSDLCCREQLHPGSCSAEPMLHIIDSQLFPDRLRIEEALRTFVAFMKRQLANSSSSMKKEALAATTFDFICFATMISKAKHFILWDEEFDNLRKIIYAHVAHISMELHKLGLKVFDQNKELLCPVLGETTTITLFINIVNSPQDFIKSNTILSSEDLAPIDYKGPYIIPISQTGIRMIGECTLCHKHNEPENWRTILKSIVEFQLFCST
jgi:hypothetical protein